MNVEHYWERGTRGSIRWLPYPQLQAVFLAWTRSYSHDVAVDHAVRRTRKLNAAQGIGGCIDH